jgi:hypothetical protein
MKNSELKQNGYYILISVDERKKYTQYEIVKDIDSRIKKIHCELNKAGYKYAKEHLMLPTQKREVVFLNSIPFAETNKSNEPMQEYCI